VNDGYARRVQPFLGPEEELEAAENVVCVATGRGVHARAPGAGGVGLRVGGALGDRLGRVGAVTGAPESVARSIPYRPGGLVLGVTQARVGLWTGLTLGAPAEVWSAPREIVARVERRPRRTTQGVFVDVDAWLGRVTQRQGQERASLLASLECAVDEVARLEGLATKVDADYLRQVEAGADEGPEVAARALTRLDTQLGQAKHRMVKLQEAVRALDSTGHVDAMLDYYNRLSAAVRGHLGEASLSDVNAGRREVLECVLLIVTPFGIRLEPRLLRERDPRVGLARPVGSARHAAAAGACFPSTRPVESSSRRAGSSARPPTLSDARDGRGADRAAGEDGRGSL